MEDSPRASLTAGARLPLVSIGVPAYNEEAHIRETLASLAALDYPNLEYIISDNASTDATAAVCAEFCREDRRFVLYRSDTNRGAGWNFRHVVDLAHGEFFMWAGGHDLWCPSFVSTCVGRMRKDRGAVLCFTNSSLVSETGEHVEDMVGAFDTHTAPYWIRPWITAWMLFNACGFPVYGVFDTKALKQVPFPCCYGPDVVLLFELAFLGHTAYVPGPALFKMRGRSTPPDVRAALVRVYGRDDITAPEVVRDTRRACLAAIKRHTRHPWSRIYHYLNLHLYMREIRRKILRTV